MFGPPLTIVDVGARWGIGERWASLGSSARIFGFDPDEDECRRLNAQVSPTGPSVEFIARALGSETKAADLFVTVEPACSSLYPPLERLVGCFDDLRCIEPVSTTPIELSTLDDWCTENEIETVDFIKIDTQGSELDVMDGATRTLRHVSLMEIEVEFNAIYEGQPLFGDVDAFARAAGFALWRLDNLVHYSDVAPEPIGDEVSYYNSVPEWTRRSSGQLYWGHAHYVRREMCPGMPEQAPMEATQRCIAVAEAAGLTDLAAAVRRKSASAL